MKVLFCHIPKCSGTNINYYLEKKSDIDYVWYCHRILKYDLHKYDNYYKFAIVRDPIEKLVSLYFYTTSVIKWCKANNTLSNYQEGNWNTLANLYKKYIITDIKSFLNNYSVFYKIEIEPQIEKLKIHNAQKNMSIFYVVGFLPQYLFIFDDNFILLVDEVVNIKDSNTFMYDKFGIAIDDTNKLNVHEHSNDNYYGYLTEKNINDIKKIYAEDYRRLFSDV